MAPAKPVRRSKRRSGTSKGKVKDKAQHAVILDKAISEKLQKDVQSYRLITVAVLVDRLKINGSLARKCLNDLEEKGVIKKVVNHHALNVYSMLESNRLPLGFLLTQGQLGRLLLRNKFLDTLRCHGHSSFDRVTVQVDGREMGICNGFGTFRCSISMKCSSNANSGLMG
ncbi:S25 ribosomal protein-domain-containing protein [Bisporella sp. PMI_857]|nr:S25 ribosomal protein-domain-containing protein [Bisporella sp. PMI_857]